MTNSQVAIFLGRTACQSASVFCGLMVVSAIIVSCYVSTNGAFTQYWRNPTPHSNGNVTDNLTKKTGKQSRASQPVLQMRLTTAEIIVLRDQEVERLISTMRMDTDHEIKTMFRKSEAAHRLVQLRAVEATLVLCEEILCSGQGLTSATSRPAAEALIALGGSSLPGIYQSLETTLKTDEEIKLFAFVLSGIDQTDRELTIFRLERQIKQRTDVTARNTTFNDNTRRLLNCFSTPDFFILENNPLYGN